MTRSSQIIILWAGATRQVSDYRQIFSDPRTTPIIRQSPHYMFNNTPCFSIIVLAFAASAVVFVSFSLAALFAEKRSMLFLGGTLSTALTGLTLLGFANLFFRIPGLAMVIFWFLNLFQLWLEISGVDFLNLTIFRKLSPNCPLLSQK